MIQSNKKIILPELEIFAEDNKNRLRKISTPGSPYPSSMRKSSGTIRGANNEEFPEIMFDFEMGKPFPLSFFRSELVRDVAFQKIKHSEARERVTLKRNDFFKPIDTNRQSIIVSSLLEVNFKQFLEDEIMKQFGSLTTYNKNRFVETPISTSSMNNLLQNKFPANSGLSKKEMVVQFCNSLKIPKNLRTKDIPNELFYWYFISRMKHS
jgi:hypothetical protein